MFDGQGFPIIVTQAAGAASVVKHYDNQGFLITTTAALASRSSPTEASADIASSPVVAAQAVQSSNPPEFSKVSASSQVLPRLDGFRLVLSAACCMLGGMIFQ